MRRHTTCSYYKGLNKKGLKHRGEQIPVPSFYSPTTVLCKVSRWTKGRSNWIKIRDFVRVMSDDITLLIITHLVFNSQAQIGNRVKFSTVFDTDSRCLNPEPHKDEFYLYSLPSACLENVQNVWRCKEYPNGKLNLCQRERPWFSSVQQWWDW